MQKIYVLRFNAVSFKIIFCTPKSGETILLNGHFAEGSFPQKFGTILIKCIFSTFPCRQGFRHRVNLAKEEKANVVFSMVRNAGPILRVC